MTQDVVCLMEIDPANAAASTEHRGKTYHFCSLDCHERFLSDPDRYSDPDEIRVM